MRSAVAARVPCAPRRCVRDVRRDPHAGRAGRSARRPARRGRSGIRAAVDVDARAVRVDSRPARPARPAGRAAGRRPSRRRRRVAAHVRVARRRARAIDRRPIAGAARLTDACEPPYCERAGAPLARRIESPGRTVVMCNRLAVACLGGAILAAASPLSAAQAPQNVLEIVVANGPLAGTYTPPAAEVICLHAKTQQPLLRRVEGLLAEGREGHRRGRHQRVEPGRRGCEAGRGARRVRRRRGQAGGLQRGRPCRSR